MKYFALVTIIFCAVFTFGADTCGIGPFPFKVSTDKKQHPQPKADADSALIYVLNDSNVVKSLATLSVDGTWIGATRRHDYFTMTIPAGKHTLCSEFHLWQTHIDPGALKIDVEAGRIYNVEQVLEAQSGRGRIHLRLIDDAEAKLVLPRLSLSVSSAR